MNRRDFFSSLLPTRWSHSTPARTQATPTVDPHAPMVAVIAGRHCLAYQGSFCSTCRERCPVAGAIVHERGMPRVDPDLCNGCRVCMDVCPAPTPAILMFPKRSTAIHV